MYPICVIIAFILHTEHTVCRWHRINFKHVHVLQCSTLIKLHEDTDHMGLFGGFGHSITSLTVIPNTQERKNLSFITVLNRIYYYLCMDCYISCDDDGSSVMVLLHLLFIIQIE